MERISVFIDGSNLYHIIKNMFQDSIKPVDFCFEEFIKELVRNRYLINIYYYNSPLDRKRDERAYRKQQQFFNNIKRISKFNLVLCRMQKVKIDGKTVYQVKEDDIHLAVDLVKFAYKNEYDTAILVSSDGDFVPAIKAVQEIGKKIENIGFENKFSYHLKQVCNYFRKFKKKEIERLFD